MRIIYIQAMNLHRCLGVLVLASPTLILSVLIVNFLDRLMSGSDMCNVLDQRDAGGGRDVGCSLM